MGYSITATQKVVRIGLKIREEDVPFMLAESNGDTY